MAQSETAGNALRRWIGRLPGMTGEGLRRGIAQAFFRAGRKNVSRVRSADAAARQDAGSQESRAEQEQRAWFRHRFGIERERDLLDLVVVVVLED